MARPRPRFITIGRAVRARHPDVTDLEAMLAEHRVIVDGRIVTNPNGRVRADASIRVLPRRRLRGVDKLNAALAAFDLDLTGRVAVDVGAAAGGFTIALLEAGVAKVYAVDTGFGQLLGSLRADGRVVNLERTNVDRVDRRLIPDVVGVVTMDLSYVRIVDAIGVLDTLELADDVLLLALVKPTFELAASAAVVDHQGVREAISVATSGVEANGWTVQTITVPARTGRRGAVEAFLLARRVR